MATFAKRPTEGEFTRKKRSRINTTGDSAFTTDNDDDDDEEMSESSGSELNTPSSTASIEDEMVTLTLTKLGGIIEVFCTCKDEGGRREQEEGGRGRRGRRGTRGSPGTEVLSCKQHAEKGNSVHFL